MAKVMAWHLASKDLQPGEKHIKRKKGEGRPPRFKVFGGLSRRRPVESTKRRGVPGATTQILYPSKAALEFGGKPPFPA